MEFIIFLTFFSGRDFEKAHECLSVRSIWNNVGLKVGFDPNSSSFRQRSCRIHAYCTPKTGSRASMG